MSTSSSLNVRDTGSMLRTSNLTEGKYLRILRIIRPAFMCLRGFFDAAKEIPWIELPSPGPHSPIAEGV